MTNIPHITHSQAVKLYNAMFANNPAFWGMADLMNAHTFAPTGGCNNKKQIMKKCSSFLRAIADGLENCDD